MLAARFLAARFLAARFTAARFLTGRFLAADSSAASEVSGSQVSGSQVSGSQVSGSQVPGSGSRDRGQPKIFQNPRQSRILATLDRKLKVQWFERGFHCFLVWDMGNEVNPPTPCGLRRVRVCD